MIEGIEDVTTKALGLALDATVLRHQAMAANIANAHTLGYVPQRVNFEEQLVEAARSLEARGFIEGSTLASVQPLLAPRLGAGGLPTTVQLYIEMADLSRNTMHYQALVKGVSQHLGMLAAAASDGRK